MTSAQSREESVFISHHSKLRHTLTDIDTLLPHFVEGDIISESKLNEMKSLKSTAKVTRLLTQISNQLKAGHTKDFYAMLSIMKKYGDKTTKDLSCTIMSTLRETEYNDSSSEKDTGLLINGATVI